MAWLLVRLDDRLLHGQVAVGWTGALRPRQILVADDRLASSGWEREMVEASAPEGVAVRVLKVDEVASVQPDEQAGSFLLLRSPLELARLVRAGIRPPEVNVGGQHTSAGKTRLLDYIHMDSGDAAMARECAEAGVRLFAQDVPGNPRLELLPLLSKAGL